MKRLLYTILFAVLCFTACDNKGQGQEEAFPDHKGYRIYVVDNTGWNNLNLYMYGTVNDLVGAWPGMKPSGKITIKNKEYKYYDIDQNKAYGNTEKLIFNNTTGSQTKEEPSIKFEKWADFFFTVTSAGAEGFNGGSRLTIEIDNGPIEATAKKVAEITVPDTEFYRIYQANPKLYKEPRLDNLKARISTIKSLGTDILYLMPIYTEGSVNSVGSPYCVKDFRAVNPKYGTLSDLKALVDAAHEAGMKVMFDWVANHTAWDCAWTSTHKEWYKQDSSGKIVNPTADGNWTDVAQLDYSSTALREEMTDCMLYWVRELDIDGYRCDYAHGPDGKKSGSFDEFWKYAINALRQQKPGFIMLAESDYDKMFTDGFDMNYSRPTRSKLISSFVSGDAEGLASTIVSELKKAPAGCSKLMFQTNHDEASILSPRREFPSDFAVINSFALLRALPASTLLYGSQEIGYSQAIDFCKFDNSFNWDVEQSYLSYYAKVLQQAESIKRGNKLTLYTAGPVLILEYADGGMLAVNTSSRQVTVTLHDGRTEVMGAYSMRVLDS